MMGEDLLRFNIHYSGEYEDCFMVSGETMDEVRTEAYEGCRQRGWSIDKCWSEEIPGMRWAEL